MAGQSASSSSVIAYGVPILTVISKRLSALRKKLRRISQMEASVAQGKPLNIEQTKALSSKSDVVAIVDELEKFLPRLEKNNEISDGKTDAEENVEPVANDGVSDLLQLLYFASLFNVQTLKASDENMLMRTHERTCCLSYDYVTDDSSADDLLKERDLDLISQMGKLAISRPVNSTLSHKDALEKCVEHARLWLANSDQPTEPNSSVTYADARKKLNKIIGSDYFTTRPQVNPIEVSALCSSYTLFQCPEPEYSIPQIDYPVSMDDLPEESEEEEQSQNSDGDNGETGL